MNRQRAKALPQPTNPNVHKTAAIMRYLRTLPGTVRVDDLLSMEFTRETGAIYRNETEVEQALRGFSSQGLMTMGVERDDKGAFVQYVWTVDSKGE